ncbi:unnamed protein product [Effrenium voratum]|nr:unnamed protein product [Effrenium voratum]
MDRTAQLEEMISQAYSGNEFAILGELQLAYIAFLLGQNFDGFEQWRALLQLLCSCEEAAMRRTELFAELLRVFFAQLSQAPSDLFGDDLTKDNFMGSCALSLLEICETDAPKLQKRCAKLRRAACACRFWPGGAKRCQSPSHPGSWWKRSLASPQRT